ncbi:MAG: hypothetical protein ILA11_11110 [Butyrivibrio sp.]|nr:hypothetical protein [Butyrivibrio sp.]
MSYTPYFRKLSHTKSFKEIVDRTRDDDNEASEFTNEKFKNRKGNEVPEWFDDIQPAMLGKKPVKPEKGMRKFKGSKTIRKPDTPEEDPEFGFYDPFGPEPEPFHTSKAYDPEFGFYDGFGPFGF